MYGRCGSGWPNGSSEHLLGGFQQHKEQQLNGQGSYKGGCRLVKCGRGRASQGSMQPQLIYSPKRGQGGKGGRRMDKNAYREENIDFTAVEQ